MKNNNKPDLYERLRLKGLEASRQAEIKKITTNHIPASIAKEAYAKWIKTDDVNYGYLALEAYNNIK